MKALVKTVAVVLVMPLLGGCQYMSFFKTNTTTAPMGQQNSPEAVCSALGGTRGDTSFDWCVAEEEKARGNNELGFPQGFPY
jgi:hypothetical protein